MYLRFARTEISEDGSILPDNLAGFGEFDDVIVEVKIRGRMIPKSSVSLFQGVLGKIRKNLIPDSSDHDIFFLIPRARSRDEISELSLAAFLFHSSGAGANDRGTRSDVPRRVWRFPYLRTTYVCISEFRPHTSTATAVVVGEITLCPYT